MSAGDNGVVGRVRAVGAGLVLVTATLEGESGSAWVTVEARAATEVVVSRDSLRFGALDDTARLAVEVLDQAGEELAGAEVAWSSSDLAVAWVSEDDIVTALGNWSARLTARSGRAEGTVPVAVRQVAVAVTVGPDSLRLLNRQEGTVSATAEDANGNAVRIGELAGAAFAWETGDAEVATVSAGDNGLGRVKAVGAGLVLVTATLDGESGSAWVVVEERVATELTVSRDSLRFDALGDTARLAVEVLDQVGEELPEAVVTWLSSDSGVGGRFRGRDRHGIGKRVGRAGGECGDRSGHRFGLGAAGGGGGNGGAGLASPTARLLWEPRGQCRGRERERREAERYFRGCVLVGFGECLGG